jgi:hypothetical protein
MKIHHLQRLFEKLPMDVVEGLKDIDFKTCWYGSSGMDKRPMELLDYSHPDTLITNSDKVDVFFYTDIDFFFLKNRIYSDHYGGEILFIDSLICNFNLEVREEKSYILPGDLICADLILKNRELVPNITEGIIGNTYTHKSENKSKIAEFWQIIEQLYPESLINEDYDFFQKLISFDSYETWKALGGVGIKKEEKKLIIDFIDLKYQKSKNTELQHFDFNNYTYNAAIVKHKRVNGEPFYSFYIDIDDWTFERLLIKEKMKINYVSNNGGCAGPGPRCLGNLQAEYGIGGFNPMNETTDFEIIPYQKELIKEFAYSVHNNDVRQSDFYKIHF